MSKRSSSSRLERRDQRRARQPSGTPAPRRARPGTRPARSRRRSFSVSPTTLAILGGAAVVIGILVWAVLQSGSSKNAEAAWQKAQLDAAPACDPGTNTPKGCLPGQYFPPHPGPDGQLLTADDRQHVANGVTIPICTADELAQNKISDPSYGPSGICYTSNPPTSGRHADGPLPFKVLDNPAPRENLVHNMEHGGSVVWYNTDNQDVIDQLKKIVNDELDHHRFVVMSKYTDMEPDTIALTAWTRLDKFKTSDFSKKRVEDFIEKHNKRFNPEGF